MSNTHVISAFIQKVVRQLLNVCYTWGFYTRLLLINSIELNNINPFPTYNLYSHMSMVFRSWRMITPSPNGDGGLCTVMSCLMLSNPKINRSTMLPVDCDNLINLFLDFSILALNKRLHSSLNSGRTTTARQVVSAMSYGGNTLKKNPEFIGKCKKYFHSFVWSKAIDGHIIILLIQMS